MNELMVNNDAVNVDAAIANWRAYQKLCGKDGILDQSDYQKIHVKEKDESGKTIWVEREFKKKSAWQKLGRAFNVDTTIVSRELTRNKMGNQIKEAYYRVRATLPNGRSVEADALCDRFERGKDKISNHSIMTTAETRATNRAIAKLIGAGEVSVEEILAEPDYEFFEDTSTKELPPVEEVTPAEESSSKSKPLIEEKPSKTVDLKSMPTGMPKPVSDALVKLDQEGKEITPQTVWSSIDKKVFNGNTELRKKCVMYIKKNVKKNGGK